MEIVKGMILDVTPVASFVTNNKNIIVVEQLLADSGIAEKYYMMLTVKYCNPDGTEIPKENKYNLAMVKKADGKFHSFYAGAEDGYFKKVEIDSCQQRIIESQVIQYQNN